MRCLLLLLVAFLLAPRTAAQPAVVQGRVVDAAGAGLPFANVQVAGTTDGAASDRDGHFRFTTRRTGDHTLRASLLGFDEARRSIALAPGDTVEVVLTLREELIELGEAVVTASAYTTGEAEAVTLSPLEVVTTAGSNADIFLAVKAFPGTAMVDEGSGLFVRGGDVTETVTLLDGATVVHPYKYESPTGGVFGTIPPFIVGGTHFATGGFSARYGDALSGLLALETQRMPQRREAYVNLGVGAASIGADVPLVEERLGLRLTANRSHTGLLFRLNRHETDFVTMPQSYDVNLSVVWRYSQTGRIKLFHFAMSDRLGVRVAEPSFTEAYRSETFTTLHVLRWQDVVGPWLASASASYNGYSSHRRFGVLDFKPGDRTYKLRADAERELGERLSVAVGAETERTDNIFRGSVPADPNVLDPSAEGAVLDERFGGVRTGGYAEVERQLTRRLLLRAGLRADHHTLARQMTLDPRLTLQLALTKYTSGQLTWGLYHQFADPYLYNDETGTPGLRPQRAQHWIAGLHHERDLLLLRLEAYHKPYGRLVLEEGLDGRPTDAGHGYASGLDVFAKYGAYLRTPVSGWVSYSLLRARRRQVRRLGHDAVFEIGPAPFDVTHNLTVVGKVQLVGFLSLATTFRYATGRPVTPVEDGVPAGSRAYYLPVEGAVGSERLPAFARLDAQLMYYWPFGGSHNAVFYVSIGNVLNRANVEGYDYDADFSNRTTRRTDYRQFVYAGMSITLAE